MFRKIIVCCPGGSVSGGPELLHQLVHELRSQGQDAAICYYPRGRDFETPKPYAGYDAPQSPLVDEAGVLIVFPEVMVRSSRLVRRAEVAIWWLSVDNYYRKDHISRWKDYWRHFFDVVKGKPTIPGLRKYWHFAQSEYARDYLSTFGISAAMLTDYLGRDHLDGDSDFETRENLIAYNPKKGAALTKRLIEENPDLKFVPIENMSAADVRNLLRRAKLYIDFGHHPGKDRFPREAAMAGCCVVTGRRGAARYPQDVPIADQYKLDDVTDQYVSAFRPLVDYVFAEFQAASRDFETYRESIRAEPEVFRSQVKTLFA